MHRPRWKLALVIAAASIIGFAGIPLYFDYSRRLLVRVASIGPIPTFINRLQRYGIPKNDAECMKDLKTLDVDFKEQVSFSEPLGCKVEYGVRLARAGNIRISNAPLLTCRMATELAEFEQGKLQSTAKRILGSEIKRIKHIGTYNCRSMRQYKGIISQHGYANAIDVSGFILKDGRSISVAKDWNGNGKKARFLKAVASSACQAFRVSVSPDGDANHWNHLHWDMGIYRSCR